jgi:hypothetical protein
MSPGLLKVAERAKQDPDARFNSLAHLLDEAALERAYHRIRKDAAVGVDGIAKEQYGQQLEENLRGLHERMKAKRYRHQPIRRVHIPKSPGRTRPIGVSSTEDKIVQGALREVMEAIYEPRSAGAPGGQVPEAPAWSRRTCARARIRPTRTTVARRVAGDLRPGQPDHLDSHARSQLSLRRSASNRGREEWHVGRRSRLRCTRRAKNR